MKSKEVISTKLIQDAKQIIETARENAVRSVDFCRVQMYWKLGKCIFEEEQHGKKRADYLSNCEYSVFAIKLVPIQASSGYT